jgi:hypothetical protein
VLPDKITVKPIEDASPGPVEAAPQPEAPAEAPKEKKPRRKAAPRKKKAKNESEGTKEE